MSYCIKCGKQNPDTAKFCTGCGGNLAITVTPHIIPQKKGINHWIIIGVVALLGLLAGAYFVFLKKDKDSRGDETSTAQAGIGANDVSKLKELVHRWNNGLNNRSAAEVAALYADRLTYYHSVISKWDAESSLNDFFYKNPGFYQQVTSEITFEKVNDNMITCNFQKTATLNGKKTDYPSYLKFSKQGDDWKIVEEGDKITDYNLNKHK